MMEMKILVKTVAAALLIGAVFMTLPGCQKQEGPVERAGKQVDQTVEKVGEKIQDATKSDKK